MKEYKLARGWAIFSYLTGLLIIVLMGWALVLLFQKGRFSSGGAWFVVPFLLAMIALMIHGLLGVYRGRILIGANTLTVIGAFSTRELRFDEIRGYRMGENEVQVEPKDLTKKRIRISFYTGGYGEIMTWLSQQFPDLDELRASKERQEILSDPTFGWDRTTRKENLSRARRTAKAINWVGGLSTAWLLFFPMPYQLAILVAVLLPIVALLVIKTSGGRIRFDAGKGSPYPILFTPFLLPPLAVALRSLLDFHILNYYDVWLAVVGLTVGLTVILSVIYGKKKLSGKAKLIVVLAVVVGTFIYSYGVIVQYNCSYDTSAPQVYPARVVDKRMRVGDSTDRYLKIAAWGPQQDTTEVKVGKGLYGRTETGDELRVLLYAGKLGVPWFELKDK